MVPKTIGRYKNGNYTVTIYTDGTKIRMTGEDEFIPSFAENCDVKITDRCDGGCPFCYEGCTVNGKHARLFDWKFIESLHPYTELALNGNDLTHPELDSFLEYLGEHKIIANMTVNQVHFMRHYDKLKEYVDRKLIHGLGISLVDPSDEFLEKVQTIPNAVIHVINGIWTAAQRYCMKDKGLKVLILGYKELQRGERYFKEHMDDVVLKKSVLRNDLKQVVDEGWFEVVSFDNLAIKQLDVRESLFSGKNQQDWDTFFMGEDSEFTFYLDLVAGTFSKNSCSPLNERYPIGDLTIDEMFQKIRLKK